MTEQDDDADADSRLDALLRAANPVSDGQAAAWSLDRELDEVFQAVVKDVGVDLSAKRKARPRRARRTLVAGAVAGAVLAAGGVAAAAVWTSAHTGRHGTAGLSENDTSEWLDVAGEDFPSVARHLGQSFPFPPGDGGDAYIPGQFPHTGLMQVSGVQRTLAMDAACAWQGYWLQEHDAGRAAEADAAVTRLQQVPTWSAITANSASSVVALYRTAAEAARSGDAATVRQVWSVGCSDLPQRWAHR